MIVLFTDFGLEGPYIGQMKAVIYREAPGVPVVDLFSDAPAFDAVASAYLLAAYARAFHPGSVFVGVIDPGVGSERRAAAVRADGRWFVGPDNGLFNMVALGARELAWWDIAWPDEGRSASFHGRDVFAPVAARIARGESPPGREVDPAARIQGDWPAHLQRVIYIDHYGNAMTGITAAAARPGAELVANGHRLARARTFSDVPPGQGLWYENANGLAEIAVNQGRADRDLGLKLGTPVSITSN